MGNGFFEKLEAMKSSAIAALSLAAFVGVVRYALEVAVVHLNEPPLRMASSILDSTSFYVQMLLLFLAGQKLFLSRMSYAPIAIGILSGLIPPILDYTLAVKNPAYFYFPPDPLFMANGITPGELIVIWGVIFLFAAYIAVRRSLVFAIPAAVFGWIAMQFSASGHPTVSAITQSGFLEFDWLLLGFPVRAILILSLLAYLDAGFREFLAYRSSRVFLAACLSIFAVSVFNTPPVQSFFLLVENLLAFVFVFMFNTRGDKAEDEANRRRAFQLGQLTWAAAAFLFAFFLGFASAFQLGAAASLPALIIFLGFLYSSPIKLKRVFPLAYILEGLFFSLIFASFAFISKQQPADAAFALKSAACFMVFAIGSMIKDYKDVFGDRAAGVHSAFTLLPENFASKFWSVFRALLVVGPILFAGLEFGSMTAIQQLFCAIFAALASWLLFFAKNADREALVNNYIWLFSAFLLAISIA